MSQARSICTETDATLRNSGLALAERPFFGVDLKTDIEALQNWESDGGASNHLNEDLVNPIRKPAKTRNEIVR